MDLEEVKRGYQNQINQANSQIARNDSELAQARNEYSNMVNNQLNNYNNLIERQNELADRTQAQAEANQRAQFEYEQRLVEQGKQKAKETRDTESSNAYSDYVRNSSDVGTTARTFARSGLQGQGYAESTLTQMYGIYQNRVSTANKAMQDAFTQYDNQLMQASINNDAKMAEIALQTMTQKLQIALQGFEYKTTLETQKAQYLQGLNDTYYARNRDLSNAIGTYYGQISDINQYQQSLAEQQRQYNLNLAEQQRQANLNYQKSVARASSSASRSSGSSLSSNPFSDSSSTMLTSERSPYGLSGSTAYNLVSNLPHTISAEELESILNNANITDEDREKIANTYGMSWSNYE